MSVSKMSSLGWQASISLRQGIASTYDWFQNNIGSDRRAYD
jgi:nucleoside-diphosphate-sugar epimerase